MTGHICPPEHKHELTCYSHHRCRCDDCHDYRREYEFWRRNMVAAGRIDRLEQHVDARGVRRRLEALLAVGWSEVLIGKHVGVSHDQIHLWLTATRVTFTTHERIAKAYELLADRRPPETTHDEKRVASYARNLASKRGYARPIDWDDIDLDHAPATGEEVVVDEVAIQLALEGSRVELTREERHIAVRSLNERRYNDQEIAEMLRVSSKTIARDREELGLPAHPESYEERFAA